MIHIGTSGFGYHEWAPSFYPPDLYYEDYLRFYARHFSCCELATSFFQMPSAREMTKRIADVEATPNRARSRRLH